MDSWLNDPFNDLDAPAAEKFVEESIRLIIQTAK
jgi:hypothetical protein